ncbi:hypothetical protein CE91St43_29120 [Oscillospiraceae bacterium]|nr:hypothetical protein CE91St43_29120 [Oscillospiraceae bacterium]
MGIWTDLILDMDVHRLIALVGGGGKTSTLYALAREAVDRGRGVVVTTTTHIMPHPRLPLTDDPAALPGLLAERRAATLGRWDKPGKLTGAVPPDTLPGLAQTVLVEADGARIHPLKAPADHEPVVPPAADAVIAVAGLDCLGQAVSAACHRPERVAALLGVEQTHILTPADVARVLSSPLGGRKQVAPAMAFRCLLNKADTPALRAAGEEIRSILAARGIPAAVHHYTEEERGGACWF